MINLPDSELYIECIRTAAPVGTVPSWVRITHRPTGLAAEASSHHERKAYRMAYSSLCDKVYASLDPVTRRAAIDPFQQPVQELRNPVTLSTVRFEPPYEYENYDDYAQFVIKFGRLCRQMWTAHRGDPATVDPVMVTMVDDPPADHAGALDADLQRLEERYGIYAVGQAAMSRYANHCRPRT